jgi:hypothetical protein
MKRRSQGHLINKIHPHPHTHTHTLTLIFTLYHPCNYLALCGVYIYHSTHNSTPWNTRKVSECTEHFRYNLCNLHRPEKYINEDCKIPYFSISFLPLVSVSNKTAGRKDARHLIPVKHYFTFHYNVNILALRLFVTGRKQKIIVT